MTFDQKLTKRRDDLVAWLRDNYPDIKTAQAHLDKDTPERGYWHAGYCSALTDILNLLDQELAEPFMKIPTGT